MKKIYPLVKYFMLIPLLLLFYVNSHAQLTEILYSDTINYNQLSVVPATPMDSPAVDFVLTLQNIPGSGTIDLSKATAAVQSPDTTGVIFHVNALPLFYSDPNNQTIVFPNVSVNTNTPGQPRTQSITFKITIRSKPPPFPTRVLLIYSETFSTNVLLPIVMQSFTASPVGSSVLLKWTTSSELNNKQFMVQRSDNSKTFTSVGTVAGSGNSNIPRDYQFTDNNLVDGSYFYRLMQQDFDGKYTFSNVIEVNVNGHYAGSVKVFPNPFSNTINLTGVPAADMKAQNIRVTDISGRSLPFKVLNNTTIVVQSGLPTGIYFVSVKGQTYKLIKQ
ncbi:MAG TPA: T9SS type A sorting domain-containing protein [Chitinophagaceae bacterium]|nr:T9SS type A sorting domain-containing protein [Chitinophagaceae bacterium]